MNPFAAPGTHSLAPVDPSPKRRASNLLGVVEILLGLGFAVLSAVGAYYVWTSPGQVDLVRFQLVEAVTVSASILCVVAGYMMCKGSGRRARYLQIVPALMTVWLLYKVATWGA